MSWLSKRVHKLGNYVGKEAERAAKVPGVSGALIGLTGGLALKDKKIRAATLRDARIGAAAVATYYGGPEAGMATYGILGKFMPGAKKGGGASSSSPPSSSTSSARPPGVLARAIAEWRSLFRRRG